MVRQFPLHPDIPERGMPITQLFGENNSRIEGMRARLRELMAAEGLTYVDRELISNSRRAQELAKWAEARGRSEIHDALFTAYFARGQDIGDLDVLAAVAESVGESASEARRVLESGELGAAVDEDWRFARRLGVTGVPTYVCDGRGIVGAQPYALLERLVLAAGATPKAES